MNVDSAVRNNKRVGPWKPFDIIWADTAGREFTNSGVSGVAIPGADNAFLRFEAIFSRIKVAPLAENTPPHKNDAPRENALPMDGWDALLLHGRVLEEGLKK